MRIGFERWRCGGVDIMVNLGTVRTVSWRTCPDMRLLLGDGSILEKVGCGSKATGREEAIGYHRDRGGRSPRGRNEVEQHHGCKKISQSALLSLSCLKWDAGSGTRF